MAKDFRADRLRTHTIVGSGSTAWSKPTLGLLFYSGSKATNYAGGTSVSLTDVGTDIWMAVDGSPNMSAIDGTGRADGSSVLFMGDVVVSGTLWAERSVVEVDDTVLGDLRVPNKLIQGFTNNPTTGKALFLADPTTPTLGSNGTGTISFKHVAGVAGGIAYGNTINRDVFFHVSGSRGVKNSNDRGLALFDGDLHISGNLSLEPESTFTIPGDLDVGGDLTVGLDFTLLSNSITGSGGSAAIVLNGIDTILEGDLTVKGNDIKSSTGTVAITLATGDVTVWNDLTVNGNDIKGSAGTVIGFDGLHTALAGNLRIDGSEIKDVSDATVIHLSGSGDATFNKNVTIVGDLMVSGSTVSIGVENLRVEDPVILMGSGSTVINSDGGIAIASGSSLSPQSLTFGRGGNGALDNLWRAGRKDVQDGTVTTLNDAVPVGIEASQFRIPQSSPGSTDFFITGSMAGGKLHVTMSNIDGDINVLQANTSTFNLRGGAGLNLLDSTGGFAVGLLAYQGGLFLDAHASANQQLVGKNGLITLAGIDNNNGPDLAFGIKGASNNPATVFANKIHSKIGEITETIDKRGLFISGSDNVEIHAHPVAGSPVTRLMLSASSGDIAGGPIIILSSSGEYTGGGVSPTRNGFIAIGATPTQVDGLFTMSRHRDVQTLLSGAVGTAGTNTRGVTLATGDLVISGNTDIKGTLGVGALNLQNLSLLAANPYIHFNNSSYKIFKDGSNLKFQDNNTGPVTLTDLNSLSVTDNTEVFSVSGGEPSYVKTSGSFSFDTGILSSGPPRHTTAIGDDVYFFVSGALGSDGSSPVTRATALFGGDVHVSGTLRAEMPFYLSSLNHAYSTGPQGSAYGTLSPGAGAIINTYDGQFPPVQIKGTTNNKVVLGLSGSLDFVTGSVSSGASRIKMVSDVTLGFHNSAGEVFRLAAGSSGTNARFENNNQLRFQDDTRYIRGVTTDSVKKLNIENTSAGGAVAVITSAGTVEVTGSISPGADSTYNLGSPSYRWANVYTGDLHLKNDRGNWTIYEEPDMLVVVNNLTGKKYKMGLTPLEDEE